MRIATWNMNKKKKALEKQWDFLERVANVDVALVQEAYPDSRGLFRVFRKGGIDDDRGKRKNLGWGSAVVSYGPKLSAIEYASSPLSKAKAPVNLLRTFHGSVAIAEIECEPPIVVVSAYGIIDHGYAESTVHRILSDLTPLIDERRGRKHRKQEIILAGDLNITTQWSVKNKEYLHGLHGLHEEFLFRDRNLFARFEALGLHNVVVRDEKLGPLEGCDCSEREKCRHVHTLRHNNSNFPWQNDYVFVTEDLREHHSIVEVPYEKETWKLSDHFPLIVDFPTIKCNRLA